MVHYFRLDARVTGPVLTKASLPGAPGLDAVALRDANGDLLLNGKHLEGRCRHAAKELDRHLGDRLKDWTKKAFGPESDSGERTEWRPKRGQVTIEDLRCTLDDDGGSSRNYRLQRDDAREAGEDRMLAVLERVGQWGAVLHFSGLVRLVASSLDDVESHRANLLRTLRWLTNLGGEIGTGYGAIEQVHLLPEPSPVGAVPTITDNNVPATLRMVVSFEAPFCLAEPQLDQNIFEGAGEVPGNAIAAAIQRAMDDATKDESVPRFPTIRNWFNGLRFRHALPVVHGSRVRPAAVPLSWSSVGNDGLLVDAAGVDGPALLEINGSCHVPAFKPDWKHGTPASARRQVGLEDPRRELRTYTAINEATGVAADKKLYSYELIRPEGIDWLSDVDMPDVPAAARAELAVELVAVLNEAPLLFGKTNARAVVRFDRGHEGFAPEPVHLDGTDWDLWMVLLVTPTLLLDIESLKSEDRKEELARAYGDAWDRLSEGLFALERYFTEEALVGSEYLHRRFRSEAAPYRPYFMTAQGSVFVLSSASNVRSSAQDLLSRWLVRGLPLGAWAVDRFARDGKPGDYWNNCPFIPQNGFGEIVVNHPAQLDAAPELHGVRAHVVRTI